MGKIVLTKGLPGSGKSTWAKEVLKKEPDKWKRINKDDLRAMLDDSRWSKKNEAFVVKLRDAIIPLALNDGFSIIVDDTNLHTKHEISLERLAKGYGADFEIKDFTDVPLETCIKRDVLRPNSVGKDVIMRMYNQFLRKPVEAPKFDPERPDAYICDMDGTLALFGDKNPYDRDFVNDKLSEPVYRILEAVSKDADIVIVSGRSEKYEKETRKWLEDNNVPFKVLLMRREGDNRKDTVVKKEIYYTYIKSNWNVLGIFDDRKQVKELWVSEGLFVFDVNQTDAYF